MAHGSCKYPQEGLPGSTCPECGRVHDTSRVAITIGYQTPIATTGVMLFLYALAIMLAMGFALDREILVILMFFLPTAIAAGLGFLACLICGVCEIEGDRSGIGAGILWCVGGVAALNVVFAAVIFIVVV